MKMDLVLNYADHAVFNDLYDTCCDLPQDNIWRQYFSLYTISLVAGVSQYIILASLSYQFLFDKKLLNHPFILKVSFKS